MWIQGVNYNLRALVRDKGVDWFRSHVLGTLMESVGDTPAVLRPESFSIRELYEAVDVKDFPVVTGELISKRIMESYRNAARVGDMLTTTMPSSMLIDKIPGFDRTNSVKKVKPGMPYEHTAKIDEKYVTIEGDKYGEILDVTEEAILFDQTNQILREASMLGEDAAQDREYQILAAIQDLTGYKSYYPAGVQQDLYEVAGGAGDPHEFGNLITNILADHTDLDAALQLFPKMLNKNGYPIVLNPNTLLIPAALEMTAKTILSSPVQLGAYNAVPNPVQNAFSVIATPFLDLNSTVKWYLGDFKRQFMWKEVIPFQVQTRNQDTEDGWNRDIKASYKVRYYGTVGALDYRYVVQSNGTV